MSSEHQEAHRAAREAFVAAHADKLRELADIQREISTWLIERRRRKKYSQNRGSENILVLMQEEAKRELALLIEAPRRPDGRDSREADWAAAAIPYDLLPRRARAFLLANRAEVELHAMDLLDLTRGTRKGRVIKHSHAGRLTPSETGTLGGLARNEHILRARMPDWEGMARRQGFLEWERRA